MNGLAWVIWGAPSMQESCVTYRVVTEVLLLELKGCHYVVCVRWLDAQDLRLLASFAKVQLKVSKLIIKR